jgi:hypothetical protein
MLRDARKHSSSCRLVGGIHRREVFFFGHAVRHIKDRVCQDGVAVDGVILVDGEVYEVVEVY